MYHDNEDSFQIITLVVTRKFVIDVIQKKIPIMQVEADLKRIFQTLRKKLMAKQKNVVP